jgi:hypothetical protein
MLIHAAQAREIASRFSRGYRLHNRGGGVDLHHYRHVLALVDHANSRRASEALGISQPALS